MKVTRPTTRRADSAEWVRAKAIGDPAELAVAQAFLQRGYRVDRAFGERPGEDLILTLRVEVKRDARALESAHVALEVSRDGSPSGLATTTADLWCVVVGSVAHVAPPSVWLTHAEDPRWRTVAAGDGGRTRCVLVPISVVRADERIARMVLDLAPPG